VDGYLWGGFGTSGDGLDEKVQMGPSNSESQLKTVMSYVEIGKKEGATLACGGNRLESGA
jgi:betaine-aldehyde dehydrogenase